MTPSLTPQAFVAKWRHVELKERSACQEHFIDLCYLINHPTPIAADPTGTSFAFEAGVDKQHSDHSYGWRFIMLTGQTYCGYQRAATFDEFYNLRDAIFLEHKQLILERHQYERAYFESMQTEFEFLMAENTNK
jgi:hypothetical protein